MGYEVVHYEADQAMHRHSEIGVRVTSDQPLGPHDWEGVFKTLTVADRVHLGECCRKKYGRASELWPCMFWETPEPEEGFEQWWFFPLKEGD